MNEKEFKAKFKEAQAKDYEAILKVQSAYNSLNLADIANAKDQKEAFQMVQNAIKEQLPDVRDKDIADFFIELGGV